MATTFGVLFAAFQIFCVGPVSPVKTMACPPISTITPEAGIWWSTGTAVSVTPLNVTFLPGARARYCTTGLFVDGAMTEEKSGQTMPLKTFFISISITSFAAKIVSGGVDCAKRLWIRSEEHTSELQSRLHLV